MKLLIIAVVFAAYLIVAVLRYAYLAGKHGTDGPDGLIPLFGGFGWPLFWPITASANVVTRIFGAPITHLYHKGRRDAGKED